MRIFGRHLRFRHRFTLFASGMLLLALIGTQGAAAPASIIETISVDQLSRMMTGGQGSYLLFFTASWCGHCKEMLPALNRLFHRFNDRGLQFVGVSVDAGGAAAMQQVLEKERIDFSMVWVGESAIDTFKLIGIPMIFLVKQGQPVEKIPGKCSYTFLEGKISDFIK